MDSVTKTTRTSTENPREWGYAFDVAVCPLCDSTFVIKKGGLPRRCPQCYRDWIAPIESDTSQLPYAYPPEFVIRSRQSPHSIINNLEVYIRTIPYAPFDLAPDKLLERMQEIFLPTWLVDVDVEAIWQAEVGYEYQVVSHQDRYDENTGGWKSDEVTEARVRWEPRVGTLNRRYENISTPALEKEEALEVLIDVSDLSQAKDYDPEFVEEKLVHLPSRLPQDAWNSSELKIRAEVEQICRDAAGGEHIRQFEWEPDFRGQNWTLLLHPIFTTYYLDDHGEPQSILVHAISGNVHGSRRSSLKRAQRTAKIIIAIALSIFLFSLIATAFGVIYPPSLILAAIGLLLSILVGLFSLLPLGIAWQFNRFQK